MPTPSSPQPAPNPSRLCNPLDQNLTFTLGSEEFGIQVLHIKQIAAPLVPSSAPQSPRDPRTQTSDQVIPVADLALTFDFRPRAYTDRTCIVVVSAHPAPRPSAVTGIAPVLNIASEDIELSPDFGDGAPMPYLLGMARVQGKVRLLQHPIHALLKLAGDC